MPRLDYMIIADYVRAEGGVLHMIAGGFDRITVSAVPAARNVGIGLRMMFTRAECGYVHEIEFVFQDDAGEPLATFRAELLADDPGEIELAGDADELPVVLALNAGLPLPRLGRYSLTLRIDGHGHKTIHLIVAPAAPGPRQDG
jgi:hypothetical protein